jgi:predicted secreted hydrolase
LNSDKATRAAVSRTKEAILNEYAEHAGEHARLLRLALNEAEALAWQTGYPQLFFPTLAAEKAQATVSWHQRQRALRRSGRELAFAE